MMMTTRRTALAVATGTLAAATLPIKSRAANLPPVAGGIAPVSPPAAPPDTPFMTSLVSVTVLS